MVFHKIIFGVANFRQNISVISTYGTFSVLDPCSNFKCDFSADCVVNEDAQPICQCPKKCPQKIDHVCGSDGKIYDNTCALRQQACTKKKRLIVIKLGLCGKKILKN